MAGDRPQRVSEGYDSSLSSDSDDDLEHQTVKLQHYGATPSSGWTSLWCLGSPPCLHLNRSRKLVLQLATIFSVILFVAALYGSGLDQSLARLHPSFISRPHENVTHVEPNITASDPTPVAESPVLESNATSLGSESKPTTEAPAPKPTLCSSWPSIGASIDSRADQTRDHKKGGKKKWTKPKGFKIVAAVFYGRRRTVDVLDCYLRQNLVANGGFLDTVQFLIHTTDREDVEWIRNKTDEVDGYEYRDLKTCTQGKYGCIWDRIADNNTLYIKIDDDIVYIHEDTIPQLVQTRQQHPEAFAISANLVNAPRTAYLHHHHGAVYPFLPGPKAGYTPSKSWRPSELPLYEGEKSMDFNIDKMTPPFPGHRWLPVSGNNTNMDNMFTPIGRYDTYGRVDSGIAWRSWAVAVQQHYSLLQHVEEDTMDKYHFGIWNTQWTRYNLNFAAIWGADVRANLPIGNDDEEYITATLPRKLGRPILIDTKAIVSHLHFGPQTRGVLQSDVLDRYRSLANEQVCAANNQKRPFDESCDWVKDWEQSDQTDNVP